MSDDVIIRVEGLGKKYMIGHETKRERRPTLRDVLARGARNALRKTADMARGHAIVAGDKVEDFWALKNVNFEVKRGEVLGIIGRNGAGKSTLLKILSRITEPSEGRVRIEGRVASLLEVGTGFHAELTGRENISLNGAILGMTQREIREKFDEIVAFAEVEKFLDTPVKHYSSGMYVRLAFAVAAHLEPEILIVDEVLAVGDAEFQKKCLGKMNRVAAADGRTVLFVSHDMSAILQLCPNCILMRQGQIHKSGKSVEVVSDYLSDSRLESKPDIRNWPDRSGSGEARVTRLSITDETGLPTSIFPFGSTICIHLEAEAYEPLSNPCFGIAVHGASGEALVDLQSNHNGLRVGRVQGRVRIQGTYPNVGLYPGRYFITPWITDSAARSIDLARMCGNFQIIPTNETANLRLDPVWGKYWVSSEWKAID
jgi:lipopolysaccharide transport system ATP-binding protein